MHKYQRREKKVSDLPSKTRRFQRHRALEVVRPATTAFENRPTSIGIRPTSTSEDMPRPKTAIANRILEEVPSERVESRCSSALPGPDRRRVARRSSPKPDDKNQSDRGLLNVWNDADDARSKMSDADMQDILNADDWDTDLEMEGEDETLFDRTGRTAYLNSCRRAGIIPANYFLRHMSSDSLKMRHHGLGPTGVKPICTTLMGNSTVRSLDFSDNWLGRSGGLAVAEMLRENCFITHLTLVDNQFGVEVAKALADAISVNAQVSHLNLRGNFFDDSCAESLADIISNTVRIEALNLSHNHLGDECGRAIGEALADNSTVMDLDISWNHIGGRGAAGISKGLMVNTTLVRVNAGWNAFGPVYGAQEIGKCLRVNSTLEELDLTNNRITPEGAVLFGKGLSGNTSLRTIKIGKNPLQSAGCYGIINAIIKNPESSIRFISFQDIAVNQDFRELEKQAIEMFPGLKISVGLQIPTRPKAKVHPLIRLMNFIDKNNLKIIDFFKRFDSDGNMTLSHDEFLEGITTFLETTGMKMTAEDVDWLIRDLDRDGDGEINYSELVLSKAEFEESERKSKLVSNRYRQS